MALALYRKYRPASFAEVVGQEHVTDPLRTALAAGRINHAYLFSGPRGCGKTSSARILARSLNCEQGPTPDPCGVCPSCIALAPEGPGSLDVVELDAASHGGVDDTRELRDRAFYMPAQSRYRVFIIDEAHMVTTQGFNALLKIVEEPPEHLVFIFATTEPDKVLTTIRSRTHHYPFRLIPPATLRGLLERLCAEEGVSVEPAVFPLVVRSGGGSARDSLSVLDQLLAGAGPAGVTYSSAVALLGVTDAALLDEAVDALAAGDGASVFGAVDKVVEAGHDPRRFAADLLQRLRDLVILHAVPDAGAKGLIDAPEDQLDSMAGQASRLGAATLTRLAEVLHTGLVEMRGTTAPRLVLELMCARMLLPAASLSDGALLQRLDRLERRMTMAADGVEVGPAGTANMNSTAGMTGQGAPTPPTRPSAPARPAAPEPTTRAGAETTGAETTVAESAVGASSPETAATATTMPDDVPAGTPTQGSAGVRGDHAASEYTRPSRAAQPGSAQAPGSDRPGSDRPGSDRPAGTQPAATAPQRRTGPDLRLPAPPTLSSSRQAVETAAPTAEPTAGHQRSPESAPSRSEAGAVQQVPADATQTVRAEPALSDSTSARSAARAEPPATTAATQTPAAAQAAAPQTPAATQAAAPAQTPATAPSQTPSTNPAPAAAGATRPVDVTDVRKVWPEILAAVQRRRRTTQILLESATVAGVESGALVLSMPSAGMAKRVVEMANAEHLREALKEVLLVDWAIRCVTAGEAAPAQTPTAATNPAASDLTPPAEDDDIPDDYGDPEPQGEAAVVRDPEELAIELLAAQLGAKPLEPEA